MKPNFALSLSVEGIRLLHRTADGWTRVGEVPLDSPDLAGEFAALREAAQSRVSGGLLTKLVIPNDQIRYLVLDHPDADEAAIRAALEGATPYSVDELVYDQTTSQGRTHIAAVARETLGEAEAFAVEHDLAPVAFVAVPEDDGFTGEVFFGLTEAAAALLAPRETVERDEQPAIETQTSKPESVEDSGNSPSNDVAETRPEPTDEPGTAMPVPGVTPHSVPEDETPEVPEQVEEDELAATAETTGPDSSSRRSDEELLADAFPNTVESLPKAFVGGAAKHGSRSDTEDAPEQTSADRSAADVAVTPETSRPDQAARAPEAGPMEEQPRSRAPAPPPETPPLPPQRKVDSTRVEMALEKVRRTSRSEAARDPSHPTMPPATLRPGAPPEMSPAVAAPVVEADPDPEIAALAAGQSLSPDAIRDTELQESPAAAESSGVARGTERDQFNVFGARGPAASGGPRRLATILTLILLGILLLVGFWAATLESSPLAGLFRSTVEESSEPALADASDTETETETPEADLAASDVLPPEEEFEDYPEPTPSPGIAVSPAEADRVYAATGVWLRAPRLPLTPRSDTVGAPIAAEPAASVELPEPTQRPELARAAPDRRLMTQTNPPGPGTVYDRDASGFIAATPDGTLTPEGIPVFAGTPELLPPTRPGTEVPLDVAVADGPKARNPETLPTDVTSPPTEGDDTQSVTETSDSATSDEPEGLNLINGPPPIVPPTRPGTEAPLEDANAADALSLGGDALAGVRPPLRPEDAAPEQLAAFEGPRPPQRPGDRVTEDERAEVEDDVADALADAVASAPEVVPPRPATVADALASIMANAPDPLANATSQAVAVARRPDSRPRNFDRVVAQASRRSAPTAAAPASAPQQVAAATVAPSGPVPGGVARSATRENSINLRDVNLIGVFGRSNDRRALVRLDNGRYVRVGVGDSLDGGRVTAIGDDILNYVRRGRVIAIKIPD